MLVVGIVFAAYRTYSQGERVFRGELHKQLGDMAALKVNQLMAWQAERQGDALVAMTTAAMMPAMEKAFGPAPGPRTEVLRWMDQIRQNYKYVSVELVDSAGSIRLATGPALSQPDFYRALVREAAAKMVFRYFPGTPASCGPISRLARLYARVLERPWAFWF